MRRIAKLGWLLLGACAAPPEPLPPADVPADFGPSGDAPMPDRWWTAFGEADLDRLVERAFGGNLELRAVWDRLAQAEAVGRREAAPLLPVVGGGAAVERVIERSEDDRDAATVLSLQAFADYEVDLWGRLRAARNAADFERVATAHDVQAAAVSLSAAVALTWVQLLEQAAQIEVLDRQIETNQQVHEVVLARFLAGRAAAADVLRQRQLVEARRGDRIEAEAAAATFEHRLALLLGLPPRAKVVERRAALPALPPLPAAGLPSDLLRRRPDVLRARAVAIAADHRLASALADRYPRLTLSASGTTSGGKVRDLFDNWLASFVAGVLDPLFDAGARQAEADRTRAVLSQRLHEYGQTVLVALREVEDALALEAHQVRLLASLDAQLELAAGAVERVRDQYSKGGSGYLDVLDALLTRQALERDTLAARRILLEIRISLYRALAGGWTIERPPMAGGTR